MKHDNSNFDVLIKAVKKNDLDTIKRLVAVYKLEGPAKLGSRRLYKQPALNLAIRLKKITIIRYLVEKANTDLDIISAWYAMDTKNEKIISYVVDRYVPLAKRKQEFDQTITRNEEYL